MLPLLLISMLISAINIQLVKASGPIYIRADGSVDPPTAPIQRNEDIYTFMGNIYDEIVVERDNIVVDGVDFTLQGTRSETGIDLTGRSNVTIKNIQIRIYEYGIWLGSSSNNSITGNNITNNPYGIWLSESSSNSISGNNITANKEYGIYLRDSTKNSIVGNMFANDGLAVEDSYGNVVEDNFVNGKPLVYLEGVSGFTIENAGQVILINCNSIRVENLNISHTDIGIELWNTKNTSITGNNITNNFYGIWLGSSSNNSITGNNIIANEEYGISHGHSSKNSIFRNNITNNGWDGIRLFWSSYNNIAENNITNNGFNGIQLWESSDNNIVGNNIANSHYGIQLQGARYNSIFINNITNNFYGIGFERSSINRFYHNNFIHNTRQVYVVVAGYTNDWDNGYPSGGNYWSDYAGVDVKSGTNQDQPCSDGICDTPYIIDADNQDRYPLMKLWAPLLLGDLNGDGVVNIGDLVTFRKAFGSYPGHPRWNPNADLDDNGVINILDCVKIAKNFGKTF